MINILHAIDTTGPGGAETVFIELLSRLDRAHYKTTAVIRGKGWVYDELKQRGLNPYIVPAKGSFNLRYLIGLIKIIRKERINIIQSHLLGSNVYCCLAGWFTRTPVVTTFHGAADISGDRLLKHKFFLINAIAKRIVLVSETLKRQLLGQVHLRLKKTRIIYNGIAMATFRRERTDTVKKALGLASNDILVGSIGNIRPPKGYDVLLNAAAEVIKRNPNIKFAIAGHEKQPLYDDLLTMRNALDLQQHVFFLGFCNDVPALLNGFDLYVLPSTSEGFSISTIEAMASRVPVVVTRSGGPEEIVTDGRDGILVTAGSSDELAKAILRLADNRVLQDQLTANAVNTVSTRFTIDQALDAYESVYKTALESGRWRFRAGRRKANAIS